VQVPEGVQELVQVLAVVVQMEQHKRLIEESR